MFRLERPRWLKRWMLIAAGTVVLIVALFNVGVTLAGRSSLCNSCHEIAPAHEQWRISSHYGVDCIACHTRPGISGYVKTVWQGAGNLLQHYSGNYSIPVQADVSDDSCLRCHSKEERPDVIPQASLRIAHSKHTDQECADCHGRLVHTELLSGNSPVGVALPHEVRDCTVCHTPENCPHGSATVDCTSCHSGIIPEHDLSQKRGAIARESCQECHEQLSVNSPDACQTCHISPHGVNATCSRCHTSATTWTEHTFRHPVELTGRHAELTCPSCHTQERFTGLRYVCSDCHTPPTNHFGTECQTCHQPGYKFEFNPPK